MLARFRKSRSHKRGQVDPSTLASVIERAMTNWSAERLTVARMT